MVIFRMQQKPLIATRLRRLSLWSSLLLASFFSSRSYSVNLIVLPEDADQELINRVASQTGYRMSSYVHHVVETHPAEFFEVEEPKTLPMPELVQVGGYESTYAGVMKT